MPVARLPVICAETGVCVAVWSHVEFVESELFKVTFPGVEIVGDMEMLTVVLRLVEVGTGVKLCVVTPWLEKVASEVGLYVVGCLRTIFFIISTSLVPIEEAWVVCEQNKAKNDARSTSLAMSLHIDAQVNALVTA